MQYKNFKRGISQRKVFKGKLAGAIVVSLLTNGVLANGVLANGNTASTHRYATASSGEFRHIEQPLSVKMAITFGGLALIGLELWWFLRSKPQNR